MCWTSTKALQRCCNGGRAVLPSMHSPIPKPRAAAWLFPDSHLTSGLVLTWKLFVFFFLIFDHVCFSKGYFTEFCLLSICQDLPCCIPVGIIYKLIESIVTLWARFKGIYPAVFECPSSESSGQDFSKPLLQEGAAWGTNSVP